MSAFKRQRFCIGLWLAIAGVCVAVAAIALWRSAPATGVAVGADLTQDAPGLYVDERRCAECHPTQAAAHPQTGHANTFRLSWEAEFASALEGISFSDPERDYAYQYQSDPGHGLSVTVPQKLGGERFPLTYAFGSESRGVTFLTLIPNRLGETVGLEHRGTLKRSAGVWQWALTRGQAGQVPQQQVEHFGRLVKGDALMRCVECHTTRGEIVAEQIPGLQPHIGCQRCHGPGREHVLAMRRAKQTGRTPAPAAPRNAVEQIRKCTGCHLLPDAEEQRDAPPEHFRRMRFQAAELLQSRCFAQSDNRLSCATCHDPHAPITHEPGHYEQRCQSCHAAAPAAVCPVAPRGACLNCHMPLVTVTSGDPWHDHRIPRQPQ